MDKMAQAGLEYLMSYGWALVLVATIIGAIILVASPPTSTVVFSSTQPTKILVQGASAVGNEVELKLQNITGGKIGVTKVTLSTQFSGGTANGQAIESGAEIDPPILVHAGGILHIENVSYPGGTAGGRITIDYSDYANLQRSVDIVSAGGGSGSQPSGWNTGEPENPHEISDCAALQAINDDLEAHYVLTNDIDCLSFPFVPIGSFSGSLDGKGYAVTGLTMGGYEDNKALFTFIASGGEVKNLSLTGANITGRLWIAALASFNYGTISNSDSTGNITGKVWVGGLVGQNWGTIEDSHSTATVLATPSDNNHIGGLAGTNIGEINNCYSTGSVTLTAHGTQVGGLVGYNGLGSMGASINNSYSTSQVNASVNYTGGLVGDNAGNIDNCYATGTVTGGSNIGGLVGRHSVEGTITNSYATGTVNEGEGESNIGGLIGADDIAGGNSCVDSFWDTETSGEPLTACGATGKTTAEMKQQATFTNWDFASVWAINEGNDYPRLQWE